MRLACHDNVRASGDGGRPWGRRLKGPQRPEPYRRMCPKVFQPKSPEACRKRHSKALRLLGPGAFRKKGSEVLCEQ